MNTLEHGDQDHTVLLSDTHILDGNVLLHCLTSVPETFALLARKLFSYLPHATSVHFVTDTYKEISTKYIERLRRGTSQPLIIKESATKVPRNFQKFLSNDENKKNLTYSTHT